MISPEDFGILKSPEEDKNTLRELNFLILHSKKIFISGDDPEIFPTPLPLPEVAHKALAQAIAFLLGADFIQITPLDAVLTTQEAAEFLGLSRPTLIKLLEQGDIPYSTPTPGQSHRRVNLMDLVHFRDQMANLAAERGRPELLRLREEFLRTPEDLKAPEG